MLTLNLGRRARPRARLGAITAALALTATACGAYSGSGGGSSGGDGPWEPQQDVRLIIHASPGGSSDLMARTAAKILTDEGIVEQSVTPENREGGSGAVAYTFLLGQASNPHYLAAISGTYIATPASGKADYNYADYTNFAVVSEDASLLAVSADSAYQTLDDVIKAAKADPGGLRYGGTQTGGADSIVHYLLQEEAGIELSYVPFTGGGEVNAALLGGNVEVITGNPAELKSLVDGGRIRPLAVTTAERIEGLDVPTFTEQGVDLVFTQARGFIGPPELTDPQVTYWQDTIRQMTETQAWKDYLATNFLQPSVHIGDDAQAYLDSEWDTFTQIYEQLGIREG